MDPTAITVAVVGAAGLVGQALANTRRTKKIAQSLGEKNGEGDAIAILEFLKRTAQRHEEKLDTLMQSQVEHLNKWHHN